MDDATQTKATETTTIEIGSEDRTVPVYRCRAGQSVDETAKALAFRVLSRAERRDPAKLALTVAVVADDGIDYPAVKA